MRNHSLERIVTAIIGFFSMTGSWIVSNPNPVFYLMLAVGSILIPLFAAFLVVCLLCWAYGGRDAVRNY
ncbi:MAG: hypothetical protein DRN37_08830 [Thermoplasmata archaeon]|nr:MAG: hypothetical protein DRN37_08830 [Thermoplasmata archaeon]